MAFTYYVGQTLLTANIEAFYQMKQLLKSVGWIVDSSSDGLTIFPNSDGITSASSGAGGLDNNLSWFTMHHPPVNGITNYLCFCMSAGNNYDFRIKISTNPFTMNIIGAQIPPAAVDEYILYGAGTDNYQNFSNFLQTTFSLNEINFIAGDQDEDYSFFFFTNNISTKANIGFFCMESLMDTNSLDRYPFVFFCNGSSTTPNTNINDFSSNNYWQQGSTNRLITKVKVNYPNEAFSTAYVSFLGNGGYSTANKQAVGNLGTNPYDGKDILLPSLVFTSSVAPSYKGTMKHIYLNGTSRNKKDTNNSQTRISFGLYNLPWNGTTP